MVKPTGIVLVVADMLFKFEDDRSFEGVVGPVSKFENDESSLENTKDGWSSKGTVDGLAVEDSELPVARDTVEEPGSRSLSSEISSLN